MRLPPAPETCVYTTTQISVGNLTAVLCPGSEGEVQARATPVWSLGQKVQKSMAKDKGRKLSKALELQWLRYHAKQRPLLFS